MIDHVSNDGDSLALQVVGIGGAGINAVNAMLSASLMGVVYIAVSSRESDLLNSNASHKVLVPKDAGELTMGHNISPPQARTLVKRLSHADMAVFVAGMGGGTAAAITPVIAGLTRDAGVLTVAVVMLPFSSEGQQRRAAALQSVEQLRSACDCIIIIPNDQLRYVSDTPPGLLDLFKVADDLLLEMLLALTEQGRFHGDCFVKLERIRTILQKPGNARIVSAMVGGEGRVGEIAAKLMESQLLEGLDIRSAEGLIINVTGSSDLTVTEYEDIIRTVVGSPDNKQHVVSGMALNEALDDQIKVSVIATGLKEQFKDSGTTESHCAAKGFVARVLRTITRMLGCQGYVSRQ